MNIISRYLLFVVFAGLGCRSLNAADLINPPKEGTQYQTLYFYFEENLNFENPFDLESNRIELYIQRPDFSSSVLSFFYTGKNSAGVEKWEARFTPKQAGAYKLRLAINGATQTQLEIPVKANEEPKQGGLRLSGHLGAFEYETGEAFRGIGINVCWAGDYEYYFKKMQAAGMNFTRIWMCPWNLSFEWEETGLGRYNLETSDRLDGILQLAEKYDIYVILCMDYHGIARKGLGFFRENRWLVNPYNKINGGPCEHGEEIFTNSIAKEFFKKKYKYLVSRYGHSAYLATWEFYNEADLMAGKAIPVNRWHVEMAEYVQSIDIHERLVSSSSTRSYPEKLVDAFKAPSMDYVMFHQYNTLNMAPYMTDIHETSIEYYQKPIVMGEFGIDFRGADRTHRLDPNGHGIHNAIWAGWFNETPVIPLSWWWDNYIDPYNLWDIFAKLSGFAAKMDFNQNRLSFKTLESGIKKSNPEEQANVFVRAIYSGKDCALWLKNMDYQWSVLADGETLEAVGDFTQIVPELIPGKYTMSWYDPQTGKFSAKKAKVEVRADGVLKLNVPSFSRDIACLIKAD